MKSEKKTFLFLLVFLFVCGVAGTLAEQLTLTTYYPSPRGEYQTVKFVPTNLGHSDGNPCVAADYGVMYYQQPGNIFLYCDAGTSTWRQVGIGAGGSFWTLNASDLYPNNATWNIGLGFLGADPSFRLKANAAQVPATGTVGIGGDAGNAGVDVNSTGNSWGIYSTTTAPVSLGVYGQGIRWGVWGDTPAPDPGTVGVQGGNPGAPPETGVYGYGNDIGVHGDGFNAGVKGESAAGNGVIGSTTSGGFTGVLGLGPTWGVRGTTTGAVGVAGVYGSTTSPTGYGVYGIGPSGVYGETTSGFYGVYGTTSAAGGWGVFGESGGAPFATGTEGVAYGTGTNTGVYAAAFGGTGENIGVRGYAGGATSFGVFGDADSFGITDPVGKDIGVYGKAIDDPNSYAGYFNGKLAMNYASCAVGCRQIYLFDIAELIPTASDVEAGDIVVINPAKERELMRTSLPYDERVAGVISENPSFSLGDKKEANQKNPGKNFQFITLAGQVECKVDASYGEIKPGDWLTTSPTPGYAMVVKDKSKALGAVIGKALQGLKEGKGKILILAKIG